MSAVTPEPVLDLYGVLADRSGCGQIRIMTPLTALRDHGYRAGWADGILKEGPLPAKAFIGQRMCQPAISARWQQLARSSNRPKLVFETDDDLFNIDWKSPSAHKWFSQADVQANLRANIAASDAVTVSTEPLAESLRDLNPNIHIIPNYLPAWLLDHQRPRRDGKIVLGWGGSFTHGADWDECGQQIRRFLERAPSNVEFHGIGNDYAREQKFPADRCRFTPWVADVPTFWRTIDYDIAVIPLIPSVFNRSKSHVKFLECALLGIPTVASDVGPYAAAIEHGKTGFLVRRPHEWARYLRDLVNDRAMREEIGANAKEWARGHTIEGNIDAWKKALL
ncbi:glycosyltransferase [Streptomyces sp. NBC_00433]